MTAHVPRFNRRVLTVFLLVGLPILFLGVALVLAVGQVQLRDNYGQHLGQVAQQTAGAVDAYVYRRILDVSLMGRTPEIRQAAAAASTRAFDAAEVQRLDQQWQQAKAPPASLQGLLDSPTSRYFADIVSHDQIYREMLLTDRQGRLIAASNPTSDYFQADEDWWQSASADGRRGQVSVTDVRWDESSQRFAVEIAVPVPAPGSEDFAGILKVVADSREMLAMVGGVELGGTGEATLLRENGSIVFSRRLTKPDAKFFATDAVKERTAALNEGGPQKYMFFSATSWDDEPQLVAVAGSQLARSYPNLKWFIAVSQSERELLAPVRALAWYLLAALGLTALAVLIFALWFSMRIAEPPVGADMHLVEHAPVMHVGETDKPILENH